MGRYEIKKPFKRATIEQLSWFKGEPTWMTEMRLEAWERFEAMGGSGTLAQRALHKIEAFQEPPRTAVPAHEWPADLQHTLDERGDEEGLIIQRDSTILSRAITKDSTKRGVIFTDLDTAVKAAPELVRHHFGRQIQANDPWAALNVAFWSGGTFLYVPAHLEIRLPFHTCYWLSASGSAIFPHTLVVVEGGSQITFIDEFLSKHWPEPGLSVSIAELTVRERAQVNYVVRPNWGQGVVHEGRQHSDVAGSAKLIHSEQKGPREFVSLERVAELYPEVRL